MSLESRHLGRKFMLALLAFATGTACFALGLLSSEQWVLLVQWTLGLYFAGNVGATIATITGGNRS